MMILLVFLLSLDNFDILQVSLSLLFVLNDDSLENAGTKTIYMPPV